LLLMTLLLHGASSTAAEENDDRARAQYHRGVELYEEHKFVEAALAFARAYELKPSYKILYNLGQAENEAGNYVGALAAYQRYLADGGDEVEAERRDEVATEIERLGTLVATIALECAVDEAELLIDGERRGTTPLAEPLQVNIGAREVLVRKDGVELHREIVKVAGGEQVTLAVEAGAAGDGGGSPSHGSDGPERVWTWVAFGVGGAAAIGAGITGGMAISRTNELEEDCPDGNCPSSRAADIDSARAVAMTSTVLTAVAGAGLLTGLILFFVEPDDEPAPSVTVSAAATGDGAGLAVGGRF
jgi:hypothetical protein